MDTKKFELPKLKYEFDALEPVMSRETVELHWTKHLQAYINNLNMLIVDTDFEDSSLEIICSEAAGTLYNNAAQTWNHIFFFDTFSKSPKYSEPADELLAAINESFGSFEEFKTEFESKGLSLFGSGWVWLSKDRDGKLVITQEFNAGNPLRHKLTPLLTADVWEHAYYVDYRNRRAEHLSSLWGIIDWSVVESRF